MTTSKPSSRGHRSITPLSSADLLDVGQVFPRDELVRRILSVFWRSCCSVPRFSRAPAPVVELAPTPGGGTGVPERIRAWWVLYDAIVEETDGVNSERLALFFGGGAHTNQLWPRYEFRVSTEPHEVEMSFHQDPGQGWSSRVKFETLPGGLLRVVTHEPCGGK